MAAAVKPITDGVVTEINDEKAACGEKAKKPLAGKDVSTGTPSSAAKPASVAQAQLNTEQPKTHRRSTALLGAVKLSDPDDIKIEDVDE